jgi:formylglycine-generating enzyme required for sulfatase activity
MRPTHIFLASACALLLSLPLQASDYTNALGMEFVEIQPGTFMMGNDPGMYPGEPDEEPRHQVAITKGFHIGVAEVTKDQWEIVMRGSPNPIRSDENPVTNMTPGEALEFVQRLNDLGDGNTYRLPTEAEWEYAARAGTQTPWHFGETPERIWEYEWVFGESDRPLSVSWGKDPNPWGLYSVLGNVMELVSDYYDPYYYERSPETDPTGPEPDRKGSQVVRGGAWNYGPGRARASSRYFLAQDDRDRYIGLRLAMDLNPGGAAPAPPAR